MPTILSAKESQVMLAGADGGAGQPIEGLQAINFKIDRGRQDIMAVGTDERIGVDFGCKTVTGSLIVKSTSDALNKILNDNTVFQLVANLKNGDLTRTVAFDQCYLDGKELALDDNAVAVTTYLFTATRIREE
jgi:hypothetical protein